VRMTVLGTGIVGQTLAAAFVQRGHETTVATRDVDEALRRHDFGAWSRQHPDVAVVGVDAVPLDAEVVVNATSGAGTLAALDAVGEPALADRVLLDVANPLDFSAGFPPSLSVVNTDSLGEQVQRRYPRAKVVKSLNTVTAAVMVEPGIAGSAEHTLFVSGDDAGAKDVVKGLLVELGWSDVIDLGDITTARGTEMYLALWVRLLGAMGTGHFNVRVVREDDGRM
jgi:8-hydroxy-5-deazaflavin:NADPH oxidoreductase